VHAIGVQILSALQRMAIIQNQRVIINKEMGMANVRPQMVGQRMIGDNKMQIPGKARKNVWRENQAMIKRVEQLQFGALHMEIPKLVEVLNDRYVILMAVTVHKLIHFRKAKNGKELYQKLIRAVVLGGKVIAMCADIFHQSQCFCHKTQMKTSTQWTIKRKYVKRIIAEERGQTPFRVDSNGNMSTKHLKRVAVHLVGALVTGVYRHKITMHQASQEVLNAMER
jgi:hypothetical protein